jgi:hypothetical protein
MQLELGTKPIQRQVKSLFDEVKKIFPNAWNWAITSVQGLIEQVPVINQLV